MDINKPADDIIDDNVGIGFQDDDGFRGLEDVRFDYFSKYSNSQLNEIYEKDINAREVIDRIRKMRNLKL